MVVPVGFLHHVAYLAHGKILVAAQHLQGLVLVVGNGVESHHLMGHRDGEQIGCHLLPVAHYGIVEVFPMEVELLLESVFRAWVGKVEGFFGRHRHIDLHHREDAVLEDALVYVSLDLIASLTHVYLASLQFDMDYGHSVDQEHHVSPSVAQHRVGSLEFRLSCYLVAALSGRDFHRVENLQIHFLAEVVGVGFIVALDANLLAVDESVHLVGRTFHVHLVHHLLHFRGGKGVVAQLVYLPVVVVDDVSPVLHQLLFGRVFDYLVPAVVEEVMGQRLLKGEFLDEPLYIVSHNF